MTLLGYIVTPSVADDIMSAIRAAFEARGHAPYWSPGAYPVHSGPHAGKSFIPADETILAAPLISGLTPRDFPEFAALIEQLGGLDARVQIDAVDILAPDFEN